MIHHNRRLQSRLEYNNYHAVVTGLSVALATMERFLWYACIRRAVK